ncbi:hypothetical protein BKA80DRAFT_254740 [Phyllosticta citrichinensis]
MDGGFQQINLDALLNTQQGYVDLDLQHIQKLTILGSNNVEPGADSSHASSMPHHIFQHHIRSLIDLQTELNSQLFDLRLVFDADSFPLSDADLEGHAGFFSHRMPSNDPWRIRRGRRVWFRRVHTGLELVVLGPYSRLQVELEVRMQLTRRTIVVGTPKSVSASNAPNLRSYFELNRSLIVLIDGLLDMCTDSRNDLELGKIV